VSNGEDRTKTVIAIIGDRFMLPSMFEKAIRQKCGGDLDIRHLIGDFAPQPDRIDIALHRREIEPLVRRNEIDRRVAPDRIHHSEFEQHVAGGRPLAERRRVRFENFKTSHSSFPLSLIPFAPLAPLELCALAGSLPQPIRDNPQKI